MIDTAPIVGANVPNSVADVMVPFPAEWLEKLREVNPISDVHSYLLPYWYRAAERWVLYDCVPRSLIDPELPVCVGLMGEQFLERVEGKPPRDRDADDFCPYVSDVQHEFYRLHNVYARPFWVLQGDAGGHQISFDPWQKNLLAAKGLPIEPPQIGTLEACPFDNRVVEQLRALSRLTKLAGNIEALRRTGSKEATDMFMSHQLRKIREAELVFLETQMAPLLDAAAAVSHRKDSRDHLMYVQPGTAGQASDALAEYRETGVFTL